jgi:hypothetical protein
MLVHSACPHCHNLCVWSDSAETKYARCAHCEKTFVVSTWGTGQPLTRQRPRRRRHGPLLWPWMLLLAITGGMILAALVAQSYPHSKQPESKITFENYERLEVGMKEAAILRLLGHPKRHDDSLVPKVNNLAHRYEVEDKNFLKRYFWEDGEDVIWATLAEGRVRQFGATLAGVQYGDNVKAPLILETQIKDNDDVTAPLILETQRKDD